MSFTLNYSPQFYDDLAQIKEYIAKDNVSRSISFTKELYDSTKKLADYPLSCGLLQDKFRKKLKFPYRYLLINDYYVLYVLEKTEVKIHRVLSGKLNFMKILEFVKN